MSDATGHAHDAGHDAGHEVNYMAKFWWLVGLTAAEVLVAWKVPGGLKLAGLAFFACWKAGIVLQHFMHLKSENLALKLVVAFPAVLILILFTLFLLDSHFLGYSGV